MVISCDRYGDCIHSHGTRLESISYKDHDRTWEEFFDYDSLGRLIKFSSMGLSGYINTMEYENDLVKFIHQIDPEDGHEIEKDSIVYTPSGQTYKSFKIDLKTGRPESVHTFEYDTNGQLLSKKWFHIQDSIFFWLEKYFWEDGNIVKQEEYDEKLQLNYEYFFEFDDQVNYEANLLYLPDQPNSWNRNNITNMTWADHIGNLDIICTLCNAKYDYNLDGLPVRIRGENGYKMELRYE
jgi:hypothetical protein